MVKQLFVIVATVAVAFGYPANFQSQDDSIISDPSDGQNYYLGPIEESQQATAHIRNRRQIVGGGVDNKGFDVMAGGTLFENGNHRVDGTANLSKNFGGPLSRGGTVDYLHKPSNSAASVTAMRTPGWGTDVSAKGQYNFYTSRNGLTTGSLSGNYDRHFGGPYGASRPNYGAFLNFNHRF